MIALYIVGGIVVAGAIGYVLFKTFRDRYDHLRRFAAVDEGKVYRCGQPDVNDLEEIHRRTGIKTIVALRGSVDNPKRNEWAIREKQFCADNGIEFVNIPSNHKNPPTQAQIDEFLDVVGDPARQPVLVHCRIGAQRTGMMCAFYRIEYQGWSKQQAFEEMEQLGFASHKRHHREFTRVFEAYVPRNHRPESR